MALAPSAGAPEAIWLWVRATEFSPPSTPRSSGRSRRSSPDSPHSPAGPKCPSVLRLQVTETQEGTRSRALRASSRAIYTGALQQPPSHLRGGLSGAGGLFRGSARSVLSPHSLPATVSPSYLSDVIRGSPTHSRRVSSAAGSSFVVKRMARCSLAREHAT